MFNLAILKVRPAEFYAKLRPPRNHARTLWLYTINFGDLPEKALIAELNKKYANRVLHDVGLCICVFDISEAGRERLGMGMGFCVLFRLVMFRPFASEVIIAKVKSSDQEGIRLSLGFFDDIYIPAPYLPQPSAFDSNERAHFWLPDSPLTTSHELLDSAVADRMYIDQGEVVRVRVETDDFYDDEPGPPKVTEGVQVAREAKRAPYNIICSIAEQGLGPVVWWNNSQAGGQDEDTMVED
ncbi:RNA polymerase III subunit Rpc25-domain-containing protein [Infundibulicybe gibba]|nr:RNA polymerase III subunit Rpc25-domain-containing protein [Infundibulicybe gibba]